MNNEQLIQAVERNLIKMAGAIRNRLHDGMSYDDAITHHSVTYWMDIVDTYSKQLAN